MVASLLEDIDSARRGLSNAALVLIAALILIEQRSIKEASNRVYLVSLHFHQPLTFRDFVLWPQSIGGISTRQINNGLPIIQVAAADTVLEVIRVSWMNFLDFR
jgi:hypothetical protein